MAEGRLELGVTGEAVADLHVALARLGWEIDAEEVAHGLFGASTAAAVRGRQAEQGLDPTGVVEDLDAFLASPSPEAGNGDPHLVPAPEFQFLVRGQIVWRDGLPIPGRAVRAFDRELRSETLLGAAESDERGVFDIYYSLDDASRPGKRNPDLVVRAYAEDGKTVATESRIVFAAQRIEKMRLIVDGGPEHTWSEYEQLMAELAPLLDGVEIAALAEDSEHADVTLLAGKTGHDSNRIAALVVAHKLAVRTGLRPEVFYAFVRGDQPTNLSELLALSPATQRRVLARALAEHIVPGRLAGAVESVLRDLHAATVRHAADGDRTAAKASLGAVVGTVLDDQRRSAFLERYVSDRTSPKTFWKGLRADARFAPDVGALQSMLQFAALSGGSVPLVETLTAMRRRGEIRSFLDLARFSEADWRRIVASAQAPPEHLFPASLPGADVQAKTEVYAATLARIVRDALPTRVIAHRTQADARTPGELRAFWSNVTAGTAGFELGRGDVRAHVEAHPALLAGVADKEVLYRELEVTQRLFNVTRVYEHQQALRRAGLTSSAAISRLGQQAFVQRFAGELGEPQAQLVYQKAATVAGAALTLLANYGPSFNQTALDAIQTPSAQQIPDFETLFGTIDLCACEDCGSITSPAAYLAELLAFLKDRAQGATIPATARDVLFARRADLGELELTCANTNTRLPYIDLVNELLENQVAPFTTFTLPAATIADLNARTLSNAIKQAFAAKGLALGAHQIQIVKPGERWLLTDHSTLYVITNPAAQPLVTALVYQTGAAEAELRANPEHANPAAYEQLRSAVYPWSLPLDLPAAQARTYLGHLGLQRAELMAAFSPATFAAMLLDRAAVADVLGLTPLERDLIADGQRVRLATTAALPSLSGTPTIDGAATAAGDAVLVKNQPAGNGIYRVAAGAWTRTDDGGAAAVTVTAGSTGKGMFLLRPPGPTAVRLNPWDLFGLQKTANPTEVFDPAHPEQPATQSLDWLAVLRWVRQFLSRAQLEYEDLIALLGASFVNPAQAVRIESADPADLATCDRAKLVLTNLTADVVARAHRFVRLWRRLGWTMRELDGAITALGAGVADVNLRLDETLLAKLAHVRKLAEALAAPVEQIVAFWAPLDTTGPDSLYARLFLDATVASPVDPAFTLAGGELAIVTANPADAKISRHASTILAALSLSAPDLDTLVTALPNDTLNLANLSALHRQAVLARGLGLTVAESLALQAMAGLNPFDPAHTEDALLFVDVAARVRDSGFSVADLDYLLFSRAGELSALSPTADEIAQVLTDLRAALRKLADDRALTPDPSGELTRRALTALRWPEALVSQVAALIGGSEIYSASLAALPANFTFPPSLGGRVTYDTAAKVLRAAGPLSLGDRTDLLAASADAPYQTAVTQLFNAPRQFAIQRLRAYEWPRVSAPLAALPAGLAFPDPLRGRIYRDAGAARLFFDGYMTDGEKTALDALSPDAAYRTAIAALRNATATVALEPANQFFAPADAAALFDSEQTPAQRFGYVLAKLADHQVLVASRNRVIRQLADAVGLDTRMMEELLTRQLDALSNPAAKALADFLDPAFAASNTGIPVTPQRFPNQFKTFVRVKKVQRLVEGLGLTTRQLDWLVALGPQVPARPVPWVHGAGLQVRWLGLKALPADTIARSPAVFGAWLRVVALCRLAGALPGGESTVAELFALARDTTIPPNNVRAALLQKLAERTGFDPATLDYVAGPDVLALSLPADFQDETGLARVLASMRYLRRLGAPAALVRAWTKPQLTAVDGEDIRRTVKALYDEQQWAEIAKGLRDALRREQRDALVAYLTSPRPGGAAPSWPDANALYQHLLADVDMDACMLTTRLKLAISSAQLFAQRCLMNLEPAVSADDDADAGWRMWTWMKNYRVWEANRKIFLYPENWLQPELRDDKTPFFVALESELLQQDITDAAAEEAYTAYLQRLDEVAHLEVAGTYHQEAYGGTPEVVHVFGRTPGRPPVHFYRRWIGGARWTPWERIDLDIDEPQIIPVIWNRRLFVFWPIITEVAEEPSPVPDKPAPPARHFEIQIAWSERKQGRWQPKKVTPDNLKIRSDVPVDAAARDHGKHNHTFRVALDPEGRALRLWYEYDDPTSVVPPDPGPYGGTPGQVVNYAWVQGFHFFGTEGKVSLFSTKITGIFQPTGTAVDGMGFTEDLSGTDSRPLNLPTTSPPGAAEGVALGTTPGRFSLVYAHQDGFISGRRPFFFQDADKTYAVVPREITTHAFPWTRPDWVDPRDIDVIRQRYYEDDGIADPLQPLELALDPVPVRRNGPVALLDRPAPTLLEQRLSTGRGEAQDYVLSKGDRALMPLGDYLATERIVTSALVAPKVAQSTRYLFQSFLHPYAAAFNQELNRVGLDDLLRRPTQLQRAKPFKERYAPTALVEKGDPATEDRYPVEDVDFSYAGAYAPYNWELFFHIPLLIATKLMQNQRFEEAQRWFHFIFDPTDTSGGPVPARYWRTRPFFEQSDYLAQRIDEIIERLAKGIPDEALTTEVQEWLANPFKPFVIARLRTVALQKLVVMRYLDNLIGWADQLFRRDTIEALNEATQLYVLAAEILGPRPASIPPRAQPQVQTPNSLDPSVAGLSDKLVDIEYLIASPRPDAVIAHAGSPPTPLPQLLYFCVPRNDKLLGYWDTLADRLFKLRHCMNIEGVVRELAPFEPPIDPALLVKAAAAGIDLSSALSDSAAPLPAYRFTTMREQAVELCELVRGLGGSLLAALESRDGQALALTRAQHETALLTRVTDMRKQQAAEAHEQLTILRRARELSVARWLHYQKLLGVQNPEVPAEGAAVPDATTSANALIGETEGIKMVEREQAELALLKDAHEAQASASRWEFAASLAHILPNVSIDVKPWGCGSGVGLGGSNIGAGLQAGANRARTDAATAADDAQRAGRLGAFVLREHDWLLQANLAAREIMRVDRELIAAEIREAVAQLELASHGKQVEEARAIEDTLASQYTNRELFDWRVGQLSALHFQAYQLAYDVAKCAERAFRFELGLQSSSFIQFGYWDSLRSGLLAGERLLGDVRKLELAYVEQNRREHELVKHISLGLLHPEALITLQETGSCFVELPEAIFDLDHPGHYLRRLKSVAVSLPCVTGPYTSVNCTLTLLANQIRVTPQTTPGYAQVAQDPRFLTDSGGLKSIVTSSAREDSGMFTTDLRDERYLPFEGAGAISSWRLELPRTFRQFDYRTISDAIMHVRYTARDGGEPLRKAAVDNLTAALKTMELDQGKTGLFRAFTARDQFPDGWQRFLFPPPAETGPQRLELLLTADRFASFVADRQLKVDAAVVFVVLEKGVAYSSADPLQLTLRTPGGAQTKTVTLDVVATVLGGLPAKGTTFAAPVALSATQPWQLDLIAVPVALRSAPGVARIDPAKIRDVGLLCHYTF
jgi:peptidoglycan hydrolase-like protein with peptidoglycan-binding domain